MFNFNIRRIIKNFGNGFMGGFNSRSSRNALEYKVVDQEELHNFLKQDVCILDVRSESEFKSMRIKNAINIPLNLINRDVQNVITDKETKILIYCVSGERTKQAIQKLNMLGYKNLYIWGNGGLNSLKYKDLIEY